MATVYSGATWMVKRVYVPPCRTEFWLDRTQVTRLTFLKTAVRRCDGWMLKAFFNLG